MANNDDLKFIVRSIGVGAIVASAMWWLFKKSNKKNNGPVQKKLIKGHIFTKTHTFKSKFLTFCIPRIP